MAYTLSVGCAEKEVLRSSQSVFETGKSKVMTYGMNYHIECEGVLYFLLEPTNYLLLKKYASINGKNAY